jgi:type IV secretory pathway TraG/TraD family ATPase VirD4
MRWGRVEDAGTWPSRWPAWLTALLLALLCAAGIAYLRYRWQWTPLQRFYFPRYARLELAPHSRRPSRMLFVVSKAGTLPALDRDVVPGLDKDTVAASDDARARGAIRFEWRPVGDAKAAAFLKHFIYGDQSLAGLLRPALLGGLGIFVLGLFVAVPKDLARARERKHGRRLKGPELVSARTFNRRNRSDGIGFVTRAAGLFGRKGVIRVPRAAESNHFLVMGDSGAGKSVLLRRMLAEIAERGETAIVYDSALAYTPQFYRPERGDIILNPLDERMPYWDLGAEVRHEAEALALATSLFPERPYENPFFALVPRKIFAHLLSRRPRHEDVTFWLSHHEEIDPLVKATALETMIEPQAINQRAGIMGTLGLVADAFKLLPTAEETRGRWSASEWSKERRGWLFVTSTPETRDQLLPLISLWLDTLVLRLMNEGRPGPRPVWFVLDELATLQKLPQLHTAITENRKSGNPVVLSFQGRSQLESRYGHDAETMLSQPATKIFLRTSEPRAADWISQAIGEIEIERIQESRSKGHGPRDHSAKSYSLERRVEPLVMASEITGLEPLHGYLKLGNLVARLSFPYFDLPKTQEAFKPRPMKELPASMPAPTPSVPPAPTNGKKDPFFE